MGFGKYIRSGIGLLGKTAMNYANGLTGGLAGKVLNTATDLADKHSGLIGKVAKTVGEHFLDEKTRNKISSYTDKAMKYIPEGKIKTALSKINNVAQGRDVHYTPPKKNKLGITTSMIRDSPPAPKPAPKAMPISAPKAIPKAAPVTHASTSNEESSSPSVTPTITRRSVKRISSQRIF